MDEKYLSITALTRYIKHKIDIDDHLKTVYLKGEISNFKKHSSGHLYFSLKDETSIIRAIMFKGSAVHLNFEPKEGMKVFVTGSIRVYEMGGTYQVYVTEMEEDGIGALYQQYEKLKKKLKEEGLFEQKFKKKLPRFPKRIGIVTASTGAAIKDILSTIERRFPICETYLFPCLVQGENAPASIVREIKNADNYNLDVIIVGRGGGSFEDLNCFNDEEVARTIFDAKTPIISAVGHEIDFTIADFVADLRAPTPTGAAELSVPSMIELTNLVSQYQIRLNEAIQKKTAYLSLVMDSIKNSFVIKSPNMMFENKRQTLDLKEEKLKELLYKKLEKKQVLLNHLKKNYLLNNPFVLIENEKKALKTSIEKLELLNPLSVLKRGYSITYINENVLKSIKDVKKNDEVFIHLSDGKIKANVTEAIKHG